MSTDPPVRLPPPGICAIGLSCGRPILPRPPCWIRRPDLTLPTLPEFTLEIPGVAPFPGHTAPQTPAAVAADLCQMPGSLRRPSRSLPSLWCSSCAGRPFRACCRRSQCACPRPQRRPHPARRQAHRGHCQRPATVGRSATRSRHHARVSPDGCRAPPQGCRWNSWRCAFEDTRKHRGLAGPERTAIRLEDGGILSVSVQQAVTSTALGSPCPAPPHACQPTTGAGSGT